MINKDCHNYLVAKKNLITPSHCMRRSYQKAITKHHYNFKTPNVTLVETDCV